VTVQVSQSVSSGATFQPGSDPPTRSDPEVVLLFARGTDKLNDLKDFLPELNNLSCCGMHQDLGSRREKRVRAEPRLKRLNCKGDASILLRLHERLS